MNIKIGSNHNFNADKAKIYSGSPCQIYSLGLDFILNFEYK